MSGWMQTFADRRSALGLRVRNLSRKVTEPVRRWLTALEPAPSTACWIRRAAIAAVMLLGAWIGALGFNFRLGIVVDAAAGAGMAWLMLQLGILGAGLLSGLLRFLIRHWTLAGVGAAAALFALVSMLGLPAGLAAGAALVLALCIVIAGAGLALLRRKPARTGTGLAAVVVAVAVIGAAWGWLVFGELDQDPVADLVTEPGPPAAEWAGLLEPGPYRVGRLSYGSGQDRRRRAFAEDVAWRSETVDGREMLGRPQGWRIRMRSSWWGFNLDELPLNGRVWYPEDGGDGLPLVLVVHGNHDMMRESDPGYAWLGEHLASRGHVVVSVDQNFVNGGVFGNLSRENATRGWLLLKHLQAWRRWQLEPTHPLQSRVDPDQVVLIGHSRGGEAVALAAVLNRLDRHPENGAIEFDFGFGIQGVAAIAPVDGQFWPSGKPTELEDVSYFTVHGGHDADVYYFSGDRQWSRVRPDIDAGRFSAALYIHHANHGQFNTRWGDSDSGGPGSYLLNRAGLMSGQDQRRAALFYLTGFVEAALDRPTAIPPWLCDPRAAGGLLPATLYAARCDDGRRHILADFEDGMDLTRGSLDGVRLDSAGLALWSERDVGWRAEAPRRQTGVFLGWHADAGNGERPVYAIEVDERARASLDLSADAVLWMDLAQADQSPPKRQADGDETDAEASEPEDAVVNDETDADGKKPASELRSPVRLEIELEDVHGQRAVRSLSEFAELLPPLPARKTRLAMADRSRYRSPTEPVLQSVAVPLAGFEDLDIRALRTIRLRFDDTEEGVLIIERIAIDPGRADGGPDREFDQEGGPPPGGRGGDPPPPVTPIF